MRGVRVRCTRLFLFSLDVPPRPVLWRRPAVRLAMAGAWLLARWSPDRIRTVLRLLRAGARGATYAQAYQARSSVVALGPRGVDAGLIDPGGVRRSLATVLLCRLHGTWPTWCTAARTDTQEPRSWVEAGGRPVGEPFPPDRGRVVVRVGPLLPPCV
ncbi:lasso peptide biosynthesis B2 protein [Streptomyces tsukubensis]